MNGGRNGGREEWTEVGNDVARDNVKKWCEQRHGKRWRRSQE